MGGSSCLIMQGTPGLELTSIDLGFPSVVNSDPPPLIFTM